MRRSDGGEAFQRGDHLLIRDHAAAEILAQHGFETDRFDFVRAGNDSVALESRKGVIDHRGVIRHPFIAALGNILTTVPIHAEETVFERSRAKVGDENEHDGPDLSSGDPGAELRQVVVRARDDLH